MTQKKIKILISGAGTATCQSVIKSLRNQKSYPIHITTYDMKEDCAGRYLSDAFFKVPSGESPHFIPAILQIIKKNAIDLFIPIVDQEFEAIAQNISSFKKTNCQTVLSSYETILTCRDKFKLYDFFVFHGIPTPKTYSRIQIQKMKQIKFPLFLKPNRGVASRNILKVATMADLQRALPNYEDPLIQDYLEGQEYTIDVLNDFKGRTIGVVPRKRLETKEGVSYKGITVDNPDLVRSGQKIAERLQIKGPANIQCFETKRGFIFTEVNPRFSGGLALTLAAGLNSPLLLLQLASGKKVKPQIGRYKKNVLMLRYWQEIFVQGSQQLPTFKL